MARPFRIGATGVWVVLATRTNHPNSETGRAVFQRATGWSRSTTSCNVTRFQVRPDPPALPKLFGTSNQAVDPQRSINTTGAAHLANDLFDHQLDVGSPALEAHDRDVFEAHQGLEDLTRVEQDEGASWLLAHTTSLKRLRLFLGDPRHQGLPAEIRRAVYRGFFGSSDSGGVAPLTRITSSATKVLQA
jgi:hypothetical protein